MPDTIGTKSQVLAKLPVNTTGNISAQDLRDAVVSLYSSQEANVLEYGADPSGMLDSTLAFENAIAAMDTLDGGCVLVPKGIYSVSKITLRHKVSLVGLSPRSSQIKARTVSGAGSYGLIEIAAGPVVRANLVNLSLEGLALNAGQWGIYAASAPLPSTGGWWNSQVANVDIYNFENGVWLRGGAVGANVPNQFLNISNLVVSRTAGVPGYGIRLSGQVNQVQLENCLSQVSGASTNRLGTALDIGPEQTTGDFRFPQGIEVNLMSMQGCQKACVITGGQNLTFKTPYLEKAHYGFDISGASITRTSEVVRLISPRFADVGPTSEVSDGYAIRAGSNSKVHATDVWFSGTCAKPFVNVGSRGLLVENATLSGSVVGFNARTTNLSPPLGIAGSGTSAQLNISGHRSVVVQGNPSKPVYFIYGDLLPGESAFGVVLNNPQTFVTGGNIFIAGALSTMTVPVGQIFRLYRLDGLAGIDYVIATG